MTGSELVFLERSPSIERRWVHVDTIVAFGRPLLVCTRRLTRACVLAVLEGGSR